MGFAVLPTMPQPGVYVFVPTGQIVLVESSFLFGIEMFFKPRQRRPKVAMFTIMKYLKYIGEF